MSTTTVITVRLSAGSYTARAAGHKITASSAENPYRAAKALLNKLGLDVELELTGSRPGALTYTGRPL